MSPLRYKALLAYLPSIAGVVNSFESPQVQSIAYELLIEALDVKLQTEGLGRSGPPANQLTSIRPSTSSELIHELVEGESIHAELSRSHERSSNTVI